MTDIFFSQLDKDTLCTLLSRTELRDAALVAVDSTLHIRSFNEKAKELIWINPLEHIDQLLSVPAADALRGCIEKHSPCSLPEELDGIEYRLEILPDHDGAVLAFARDDHAFYDGGMRTVHIKASQALGAIWADTDKIRDTKLAGSLRKQCLRLYRLLSHSDFLRDSPQMERLQLEPCDLASLCREAVRNVQKRSQRMITQNVPKECILALDGNLILTALYNLLVNAVQVSPENSVIEITLRVDSTHITVTVADRGPGMEAGLLEDLLDDWQRPSDMGDYLRIGRQGAALGLGLPLVRRIAQLHGGQLLFSPREGGGSEVHLVLGRLLGLMANQENKLRSPPFMTIEEGHPLADIELSVL